jgi:hypothetical protein
MHVRTELASDSDLLDLVIEKGIVVEAWDRLGQGGIDLTGTRVSVSSILLFNEGRNRPLRTGYFWKSDPS